MLARLAQGQIPYLADFVQLTTSPYYDVGPHWSPDGSQLTWYSYDSSYWYRRIWKMNADGSYKAQLTFGDVVDQVGDWSPDGTQLVFQRWGLRGIDAFDLMVMDSDGSNVRQITSSGPSHQNPSWSHNGSRIAYDYNAGTLNPEVHVINPDGTEDIALSQNKQQPDWSPDDKHIVAAEAIGAGNDGIWIINTSSPYEARRIYAGASISFPQFTPDGKYITFLPPDGDLHLIDIDGNYVAQLTSDGTLEHHEISRDGRWIALDSQRSGNRDIWKARIIWPSIAMDVDIKPDTLNLQSKGKWITAYIELPEGYDVADVNVSTTMLNETVPAELSPTTIEDYDNDGIADLMVKFDRAAVVQCILDHVPIKARFMSVTLTMTGKLDIGTLFEGSDTIRVIFPMHYWKIIYFEKLGMSPT